VRLWGSISFVVLVVLVGMLFDHAGVARFPVVMMLPLLMLVAGSFAIRDAAPPAARRQGSGVGVLLRSRVIWSFLGASFLLQLSHAPYYGFFSLLLSREGYSSTAIGYLWALGVIAEILFFAVAHHVLQRFSLRSVLAVSMVLAALRWLMIGFGAGSVTVLVLAQCLHAATFGSFHAAGIEFVRRHFGYADQGQGQALYSAISFGAGGALGALGSGWLWDRSQHAVFLLAALCAAAGAVLLGYSRDTPEILSLGFPVASAGGYAQDQGPRGKVLGWRVPIKFGNVLINPGDIVFGDRDGVLVVPQAVEVAVFSGAIEKARGERDVLNALQQGMSTVDAFKKFGIM
jgi:PPP family 3-phenylpropionic acid transporter